MGMELVDWMVPNWIYLEWIYDTRGALVVAMVAGWLLKGHTKEEAIEF